MTELGSSFDWLVEAASKPIIFIGLMLVRLITRPALDFICFGGGEFSLDLTERLTLTARSKRLFLPAGTIILRLPRTILSYIDRWSMIFAFSPPIDPESMEDLSLRTLILTASKC